MLPTTTEGIRTVRMRTLLALTSRLHVVELRTMVPDLVYSTTPTTALLQVKQQSSQGLVANLRCQQA